MPSGGVLQHAISSFLNCIIVEIVIMILTQLRIVHNLSMAGFHVASVVFLVQHVYSNE